MYKIFQFLGFFKTTRKYIGPSLPLSTWNQRKLDLLSERIQLNAYWSNFLYYYLTKKFQLRAVGYSYVRTNLPLPKPTYTYSVSGWWGGIWSTQKAADEWGSVGRAQQCLSETPGTGAASLPCTMRWPPSSRFPSKEIGVITRDCCSQRHLILSTKALSEFSLTSFKVLLDLSLVRKHL